MRAAGYLPEPLPQELNLQGEAVAIVVAETEDLAQDAADAIKVKYEVLPFASMLKDSMAAGCARSWDREREPDPAFVLSRGFSARYVGG